MEEQRAVAKLEKQLEKTRASAVRTIEAHWRERYYPKPEPRNPKPETRTPKTETREPKTENRKPKTPVWVSRVREGQTRRVQQWAAKAERAEDVKRFKHLQR